MKRIFRVLFCGALAASLILGIGACATARRGALVQTVDVLIVGAGGAGLAAAIQAHDEGARVIILEKMPFAGGNTNRAGGGMNVAESTPQRTLGIQDSKEVFLQDTFEGGGSIADLDLLRFFVDNGPAAVDWLSAMGMDLSEVVISSGATNPRMHRPQGGPNSGPYFMAVLMNSIQSRNIQIMLDTEVTGFITEEGRVIGVRYRNARGAQNTMYARATVLATGGFGANEELFTRFRPDLAGFVTTNHPGATGSGIFMAEAVGAALVGMQYIQTLPAVEPGSTRAVSDAVRGQGAIIVDQRGQRFIDEMATRDALSSAILAQPEQFAYLIYDRIIPGIISALQDFIRLDLSYEAETVRELAEKINVDPAVLENTVRNWNGFVANRNDPDFGRATGMDRDISNAPFYALRIAPGVHYTMGGVKINTLTQVITTDGSVIEGLFAAGEVTGGIHGTNRLSGNAITDIFVFGRQAGTQAAAHALR